MKVKIINGVNLNMLGYRNKTVYGDKTYKDLCEMIKEFCLDKNIEVSFFNSNYEGEIIEEIQHTFFDKYDALIINPGAFTHYSYGIRDALEIIDCLKIEVHLSDIYNREDFRKINVIKDVCDYSIIGKGFDGYLEALELVIKSRQKDNIFI